MSYLKKHSHPLLEENKQSRQYFCAAQHRWSQEQWTQLILSVAVRICINLDSEDHIITIFTPAI